MERSRGLGAQELSSLSPGGLGAAATPPRGARHDASWSGLRGPIDLVGYGAIQTEEEDIAGVMEAVSTLCERVRELVVRVEPLSALSEEARALAQSWKGLDQKGDALTEKASQIYYSLDDILQGLQTLEGIRDDMQQVARSTLPLHVIQENVVQAADRLRNMDPKRFETIARSLEAQLLEISARQKEITEQAAEIVELKRRIRPMEQWQRQVESMHQEIMALHGMHLAMKEEWSRSLEDLATYGERLRGVERAVTAEDVGLGPKVDTVKGLLRGLTEKAQDTHRIATEISAGVGAVRGLSGTLAGYQRHLEAVHDMSAQWTQQVAKFEPAKLQDILENVTSVHARLAGIEKAVAGIKGIEGLVMRDKALELGLQYNMEELKKKLDGLQSAHPAMASTRLEEGIGGLYEEMRRFHAATMAAVQRVAAKTDAIEAVVGRMASTVGVDTQDREALGNRMADEVALRAVPAVLRMMAALYDESPKTFQGNAKKAKAYVDFANELDKRCKARLAVGLGTSSNI